MIMGLTDSTLSGLPFILILQHLIIPSYIQESMLFFVLSELIVIIAYIHCYHNPPPSLSSEDVIAPSLQIILGRAMILLSTLYLTPNSICELYGHTTYISIPLMMILSYRVIASTIALPYTILLPIQPSPYLINDKPNVMYYSVAYGIFYSILVNLTPSEKFGILVCTVWMMINHRTGFHRNLQLIMNEF